MTTKKSKKKVQTKSESAIITMRAWLMQVRKKKKEIHCTGSSRNLRVRKTTE
jgi:hypothetical protein